MYSAPSLLSAKEHFKQVAVYISYILGSNLGHDLLMAEYICRLFLGLLLCSIEHISNFHDY